MPPLHAALPLAEVDHFAVLVGDDLDLDVARPLDVALDVHVAVSEGGQRLRRSGAVHLRQLLPLADDLHPPPAPAGGGLEDHREADLLREAGQVALVAHHPVRSGQLGQACLAHGLLGADLVAHHPDHLRTRADPGQP